MQHDLHKMLGSFCHAQVFNPDGGFPPAHERQVCVDYDVEYFAQVRALLFACFSHCSQHLYS